MNREQLLALLPLIVLGATSILILLVISFYRSRRLVVALALLSLIGAFVALWPAWAHSPQTVTPLLLVDGSAIFFIGLILAASFSVIMLGADYLKERSIKAEEFHLLVLLGTLGAAILVASNHFASFFLGLEILSVSLYGLISYDRGNVFGIEAGLKYLVLAGVSSAFLLFGMALAYADRGTLALGLGPHFTSTVLSWAGLGLIFIGIGFKLGVVPFHLWTPDVYQGAPAPVSAFIATVSKGAMLGLLMRLAAQMHLRDNEPTMVILALIAVTSMFVGNLLGLLQNNIKRILAYSSISHMGYLLVAFLAGGAMAEVAVPFYLAAYFATTLAAFGCVSVLSTKAAEAEDLRDYRGLAWREPWVAAVLASSLLSLAGIPLTAGFVGKFYLMAAGAGAGLWWLLLILVVSSVIGLFYYLRVIFMVYRLPPAERMPFRSSLSLAGSLVLCLMTALLLWLGVFPAPLIHLIQATMAGRG